MTRMTMENRFDWKSRQNEDGGWSYGRGSSWTEPTVFTLLAQPVTARDKVSFESGMRFVHSVAQPDGGFRPQPCVAQSTWVTSMVALLPRETVGDAAMKSAIGWLKNQTGQESGWRYRFQQWRAGNKDSFPEAWSWFPGAAAWAIPTTMGILAFERALKRGEDSALRRRIDTAREFLLGRQCADGGWNHGSNRALGRDGDSYPETTGLTLLAFAGAGRMAAVDKALEIAQRQLAVCRTAEGISWLRMGLAAHGRPAKSWVTPAIRTNMDAALTALADAPRNPLLS